MLWPLPTSSGVLILQIFSTLVKSQIHLRSRLGFCFICVLLSVLKSMPASSLATTATFSAVHFSMSETESSRLVASSVSSSHLEKEISAAFTDFSVFSAFSAGSVSSSGSGVVSLTHTVSSVVSPISIGTLAAALLSLPLSLLGPTPPLGPLWPLSTASGVLSFLAPHSLRQEGVGVGPS